jgi:hypothetical protein
MATSAPTTRLLELEMPSRFVLRKFDLGDTLALKAETT